MEQFPAFDRENHKKEKKNILNVSELLVFVYGLSEWGTHKD